MQIRRTWSYVLDPACIHPRFIRMHLLRLYLPKYHYINEITYKLEISESVWIRVFSFATWPRRLRAKVIDAHRYRELRFACGWCMRSEINASRATTIQYIVYTIYVLYSIHAACFRAWRSGRKVDRYTAHTPLMHSRPSSERLNSSPNS